MADEDRWPEHRALQGHLYQVDLIAQRIRSM